MPKRRQATRERFRGSGCVEFVHSVKLPYTGLALLSSLDVEQARAGCRPDMFNKRRTAHKNVQKVGSLHVARVNIWGGLRERVALRVVVGGNGV